jgi:N,N'-diacetyllegionaminate synthase
MKNKVQIIAEIGVNHNGDINLAKKLIDEAKNAGADSVKFQTFKAERLVTKKLKKANYQNLNDKRDESQYSMLKRLELTLEMHKEIILYCKKRKIEFLSSGFDIESLDLLSDLGQKKFKIPSGEITNLPYLKHIAKIANSIILSTGMSNLNEIRDAIDILEKNGAIRKKITILHCTSEYPAPFNEVNLLSMNTIKKEFDVSIGYSDHTKNIEVAIAAVALGANIIEKHFTLKKELPGPDHRASLEPNEFKNMVDAIRNIEAAMGLANKKPTKSENKNKLLIRKSIVAKKTIKLGETLSISNVTIKRPGTGISPMQWNKILGRKAIRKFIKDELIEI